MVVLGIETSCDETAASLIENGCVLTNVISSQADLHAKWGGVVPEVAARAHLEAILPVLNEALASQPAPDAVAVTNRPGLLGALSVGLTAAKSLAFARNIPLVGVHHIEGHILSPFDADVEPVFPHLCLVVSGGHTLLLRVTDFGQYQILADTVDDAAGEAYDKCARLIGLPYPGGKLLSEIAASGSDSHYDLPLMLPKDNARFSFSGLKTAVSRLVSSTPDLDKAGLAASLQNAINSSLVSKLELWLPDGDFNAISLVGGVAANRDLRKRIGDLCAKEGIQFFCPPFERCTDNAAMIALAGWRMLEAGLQDDMSLEAFATSPLTNWR